MARFKPRDPRDYLAILDFINKAKEQNIEIELKKFREKRTGRQNNYLFFCLAWFAHEYGCSEVEAKEVFLKRIAAPHIFEVNFTDDKGNEITYYRSTADLDTLEMTNAIANFRAYADMNGHPIPSPEEQDLIRYCEQQLEKTKCYGT